MARRDSQHEGDHTEQRSELRNSKLRWAGLVVAGVAIAVLVSGRAVAAPGLAPQRAAGCSAAGEVQPNGKQWLSGTLEGVLGFWDAADHRLL